jgi:hypothetical protein
LKEIFNLLSKKKVFTYAEYIVEQDAGNRVYFQEIKNLPSIEDSMNQSSIMNNLDKSMSQTELNKTKSMQEPIIKRPQPSASTGKPPALQVAK